MKNFLITGGAGFIGSNFIKFILKNTKHKIVNLDLLTYAGNLENLKSVEADPRYSFVKGNILDEKLLKSLFLKYNFNAVFHFAAESHVDRSIIEPEIFVKNNVLGTQTILDVAKNHWAIAPEDKHSKEYKPGVKFLHVSTDEVYGDLPKNGFFTEQTPLAPNSPYSASKAGSDMLVRAYNQTFGLPINITRCSNNYGPYQFPEKLIPLMINNAKNDAALPVYGDGLQIRDWLHVEDHCSGIYAVYEKGVAGEVFNIGGNNEKTNLDIVNIILNKLAKPSSLISFVKDRPGHDRRYAIDNTKITTTLGWEPKYTFEDGINETIEWYLNNENWVNAITSGEYRSYYDSMYIAL